MNNSQPTEPAGGQPDGAPPSERWIGAESARAAAPGPAGDPEPPAEPPADAKPVRARLAGALGLDAVRIRATLRIAGAHKSADEDTPGAPTGRDRSHLRLVPASRPEPEPQPGPQPEPQPQAVIAPAPAAPAPFVPPPVADTAPPPAPEIAPPALPAPPGQPVRIFSELGTLAGIVLIGTAAALGVDAVIGGLNGMPPAYLLVFLASPIWDLLPGRLPARIGVIALDTAATIGVWFLVAALPMQRWLDVQRGYWRAELAFGTACLLVGAAHLLIALALRRPRERAVP